MFEYVDTICNFLNNLKGYITNDELIELVSYSASGNLDRHDIDRFITNEDLDKASEYVEEDDSFNLFELVNKIRDNIICELAKESRNE